MSKNARRRNASIPRRTSQPPAKDHKALEIASATVIPKQAQVVCSSQQVELAVQSEKLFNIYVAQPNPYSAVVRCRWCVSDAGRKQLIEKKVRHPYMLISVFHRQKNENSGEMELEDHQRHLIKLERGWVQMSFDRPGEFVVYAAIVWSEAKDKDGDGVVHKVLWPNVAPGDRPHQFSHCLSNGRSFMPGLVAGQCFGGACEHQEIPVDEGFFAKDPPRWLARFANCWYSRPPVDECDFRRRCLHSFAWKWLTMLLFIPWAVVWRAIAILYLNVVGWRHLSLAPLIHPFRLSIVNLDCGEPESNNPKAYYWLTDSKGVPRSFFAAWLMAPWWWTLILIAAAVTYLMTKGSWEFAGYAALIMTLIPLAIFALLLFCVLVIELWPQKDMARKEKAEADALARKSRAEAVKKMEEEQRDQERLEHYYDQKVAPLSCELSSLSVAVGDMPPSTRTFRLRYLDLKAMICKPYRLG